LKCLSVSQPFAELIITGRKTIELRKWNTNFRGEFLIHAPLKIRTDDCKRLKMKQKFVTGAIIGKAELYDVKKYNSIKEIKLDQKLHLLLKIITVKLWIYAKNAKPIKFNSLRQLNFFDVDLHTKTKKKESFQNNR
jgi:hypothetical protein